MNVTYARAAAGYDAQFRRRLADAITTTIAAESRVSDAAVIAIRTSETMDALADILVTIWSRPRRRRRPTPMAKAQAAKRQAGRS
jgi:hypothetical protein